MGTGEIQKTYFTTERTNPHTWHDKMRPPYPSLSLTSHTFQHSPFLFARTLQHAPLLFVRTCYSLQHSSFLFLWTPYSLQHSPFLFVCTCYSLQHTPFFLWTPHSLRRSPFICFSLTLPLLFPWHTSYFALAHDFLKKIYNHLFVKCLD